MSGSRAPTTLAPTVRRAGVLLTLVGLLAAGCNLAASPTPTGSGAAAAPSAGQGAPTTGQFCQGVKLVFFPGGTTGGGFETVVYNGAKAAEAAFGPTVAYQWSDWDPNKMISQFREAVATYATAGTGYVGAVLHDAGAALANEAISRGGLKSGDRAFVWGLQSQPGRGERTKGILDALKAAGLTVDYLEIDDATNKDPANGTA